MKYIVFWKFAEWTPEGTEKVSSKGMSAKREKDPEKYPKLLFPNHIFLGQNKGFAVVEGTPEQVANWVIGFEGTMKHEYIPIMESTSWSEIYQKIASEK